MVRIETPGIVARYFFEQFEECTAMRAALHFCQHIAAGVLQRNIEILCKSCVRGDVSSILWVTRFG